MKTIEELQKENDELKANCFELEAALAHSFYMTSRSAEHPIDSMDWIEANKLALKILEDTPQQSLNEIKAQAIEDVVSLFFDGSCYDPVLDVRDNIIDYANKLRSTK